MMRKYSIYILLIFIFLSVAVQINAAKNKRILFISSYRSDTQSTMLAYNDFCNQYKNYDQTTKIDIEYLDCNGGIDNVSIWKRKMKDILKSNCWGDKAPQLIVLQGQEAWTLYLSMPRELINNNIAIMCIMVSRNFVRLPADTCDLQSAELLSLDISDVQPDYNIVGGFLYEYDVESNIKLICQHYPQVKNIVLLTDNTYGGLAMYSLVRSKVDKFPNLNFIFLDARRKSLNEIRTELHSYSRKETILMLGSWRYDSSQSYFVKNSLYLLKDAAEEIPAYSMSMLGMGYWTIGGYMPHYYNQGKDLAEQVNAYINNIDVEDYSANFGVDIVANEYNFDQEQLERFHIDQTMLPVGSNIINGSASFWEQYWRETIIIVLIFIILIGLSSTLWLLYTRTRNLTKELQNSQHELIEAKDKAEEGNRMKTAFLANMSHEIRTPLNAIVGFAEVLTTEEDIPTEEKLRINKIVSQNSVMLLELINDILDMSRLESGRTRFINEMCDLVSVARDALVTVKTATRSQLEYRLDAQIDKCNINIDKQRIRQVFINLLTNANKFTMEGSITITIQRDDKNAIISVADTGTGIPSDKFEKVFERFEKLNEDKQGSGLGLAMCKFIIEHYGGRIWIDKKYTEGTQFVFSIPFNHNVIDEE